MLLCQAGHSIPRDANASKPIAATIRSISGASTDKQTNRHNNDHLPDTNLMSNVIFERLICFIDSFIEEIGLITSISFHSETLLSLFWD